MDKKKLDRKVEYSINKNKYKVERKIKNNNKIKYVGCCCLAIILIAAIGSIMVHDKNTETTTNTTENKTITNTNNTNTTNNTNNTKTLYIPAGTEITYYGPDTIVSEYGYQYSIDIGNSTYYLSHPLAEKLARYSSQFAAFHDQTRIVGHDDTVEYEGWEGFNRVYVVTEYEEDTTITTLTIDKSFMIEWEIGTVIYNTHAKVVTDILTKNGNKID